MGKYGEGMRDCCDTVASSKAAHNRGCVHFVQWMKYAGDFNSMSDADVKLSTYEAKRRMEDDEDWLEAVASWRLNGSPRS